MRKDILHVIRVVAFIEVLAYFSLGDKNFNDYLVTTGVNIDVIAWFNFQAKIFFVPASLLLVWPFKEDIEAKK